MLFFAIITENYNGYEIDFNKVKELNGVVFAERKIPNVPCIIVQNAKIAIFKLAKYYRGKFKNLKSITVTGSIGKTSAKEMILSVLKASAKTFANHRIRK